MTRIATEQLKTLSMLCNALAVSGDEGEVRRIVLARARPLADEVRVDALGNVLVRRKGSGRRPLRVLLDAHMDEVGLMITRSDGAGIYQFEIVGGINPRVLPGKQVVVGPQHLNGVIGTKAIHQAKDDELAHAIDPRALRIDLGPDGRAEIGDRATFGTQFKRAGPSLLAKAIDDRIGVAIVLELLKHAPRTIELCCSFSVQEEIGLRGAQVAAYAFEPDLAIAVDATPARDLPHFDGRENIIYNTKLGDGPAIYVANSSAVDDPRLVNFLKRCAQRQHIPFQIRQPGGGGTDAGAIQQSRTGIPVVSVSVPHRYTHSPLSIARVDDWLNTIQLLRAALNSLKPSIIGK